MLRRPRPLWSLFARAFMSFRECLIRDRRPEINEEAVADLYTCLQQLIQRTATLEHKITLVTQQAVRHKVQSTKERIPSGRMRELAHAKRHLEDRRRLQSELDRAAHFTHILRQQIDTIVSSHLDGVVIDAWRGYNASAARLGLPDKSAEVENLVSDLQARSGETKELQDAIDRANEAMRDMATPGGGEGRASAEDDLMLELEDLLADVEDDAHDPGGGPLPSAQPLVLPSPPRGAPVREPDPDSNPSEPRRRPPVALEMA